ncbi:MAG: M14 family metallopeptidase [Pseudobdellovibrio sp.]
MNKIKNKLSVILVGMLITLNSAGKSETKDLDISNNELFLNKLNDDYLTARTDFRNLADKLKMKFPEAEVQSNSIAVDNSRPELSDLTIDSIFIPARNNTNSKNLIVLTSGMHGVEAPAGSFQQRLIMQKLLTTHQGDINFENSSLLIIHAINPYGFKYGRRFNENNVDLNRNCMNQKSGEFAGSKIINQAYLKFQRLLESPVKFLGLNKDITQFIPAYPLTTAQVAFYGIKSSESKTQLTQALSGQYQSAKGIYYGGTKVEASCQITQSLMSKRIEDTNAIDILHIDFHTGLGKSGISQIMINPKPKSQNEVSAYNRELAVIKALFADKKCKDICEVQESDPNGFITFGDITQWINEAYPDKRLKGTVISVTSEIGTSNAVYVLPTLINENYCFHNREACKSNGFIFARDRLKKQFNPADDQDWQIQVLKGGNVIFKALSDFSRR